VRNINEERGMTNHRRPGIADWRAGLIVGAALGAMILGIGSRLGMRVIALAQDRAPSFSIDGSIAVTLLGAGAGAVVAVFFLLARTAFPTRRLGRVSLFWALVALVVWRGLNPVSTLNVAVFAPLFLLHGGLLTAYWCRVRYGATRLSAPA
jgi:hypothetical protein